MTTEIVEKILNTETKGVDQSFSSNGAAKIPVDFSHDTKNLGKRTVRGGMIVFGSMILQKILQLAILAIMARLLTPRDYGLLGMVFAFTAFLGIFSDAGLPLATIQKADLTHAQVSNMFWLNLALGLLLGIITAVIAPVVAIFYKEPLLVYITLLCAVNFPIAALGAQHGALLQRKMAFGRLAISETSGLLAGGVLGILMALKGFGVYALIVQQLATSTVTVLGNWLLSDWRPSLPSRGAGVRGMARFGGYLTAFNCVNFFARNLDKILLGRFCGADQVGLYTRAYTLMVFPIGLVSGPISRVVIPALSSIQNNLPELQRIYLRTLQAIGFITFPLMVFLIVGATDVIAVVFGKQWMATVPIFQILCISGIGQGIYNATGQAFTASGRTDRQFRAGLGMSLILAVSFIVGVHWGAQGIALAYTLAFAVGLLPYLAYTYATVGLNLFTVLRSLFPSLLSTILMTLILWAMHFGIQGKYSSLISLIFLCVGALLTYFGSSLLINREFRRYLSNIVVSRFATA